MCKYSHFRHFKILRSKVIFEEKNVKQPNLKGQSHITIFGDAFGLEKLGFLKISCLLRARWKRSPFIGGAIRSEKFSKKGAFGLQYEQRRRRFKCIGAFKGIVSRD
jgi:hypothetical protein